MSKLGDALEELVAHVPIDLPPDEAEAVRFRVLHEAHALDVRVSNLESGGGGEDQADEVAEIPAPKKTAARTRK
jgi:hypothetical protein